MPKFSAKSEKILATCHPDIQRVMRQAIKETDFTVVSGLRGKTEQDNLYPKFTKRKYPFSKHNRSKVGDGVWDLTISDAVDIAPYPIDWNDRKRFESLAEIVLRCAEEENVKLTWGGSWKKFVDLPHFEITYTEE